MISFPGIAVSIFSAALLPLSHLVVAAAAVADGVGGDFFFLQRGGILLVSVTWLSLNLLLACDLTIVSTRGCPPGTWTRPLQFLAPSRCFQSPVPVAVVVVVC